MGLIGRFMDIVVPCAITISLFIFLPPAAFLSFALSTIRSRKIREEDMAGKVVLITGASSGIGQSVAYEYARRGAVLALAARRKECLREVAQAAQELGSPDVLVVRADVSKVDDCQRLIDKAIQRFGQLDHLVSNAEIAPVCMFEDCTLISEMTSVMETNFWGSVYATHFAIPHLRKSKGRIVVIASIAGWFAMPRLSLYNASKAALISLYETLRVEVGEDIGITMATPGLVKSEIANPGFFSKLGLLEDHLKLLPMESAEECAKGIVDAACRRERCSAVAWRVRAGVLWKVFCPEVVEWCSHWQFIIKPKTVKDIDAYQNTISNQSVAEKLPKTPTAGSKAI